MMNVSVQDAEVKECMWTTQEGSLRGDDHGMGKKISPLGNGTEQPA